MKTRLTLPFVVLMLSCLNVSGSEPTDSSDSDPSNSRPVASSSSATDCFQRPLPPTSNSLIVLDGDSFKIDLRPFLGKSYYKKSISNRYYKKSIERKKFTDQSGVDWDQSEKLLSGNVPLKRSITLKPEVASSSTVEVIFVGFKKNNTIAITITLTDHDEGLQHRLKERDLYEITGAPRSYYTQDVGSLHQFLKVFVDQEIIAADCAERILGIIDDTKRSFKG